MAEPVIRAARPEDAALIIDSWIKSFRDSPIARAAGTGPEYQRGQREIIVRLLQRSEVRVMVHPEDDDAVLGWACAEPQWGRLHYVYVKRGEDATTLRRLGLARALIDGWTITTYTHRTSLCAYLPIPSGWRFDPWGAWT